MSELCDNQILTFFGEQGSKYYPMKCWLSAPKCGLSRRPVVYMSKSVCTVIHPTHGDAHLFCDIKLSFFIQKKSRVIHSDDGRVV